MKRFFTCLILAGLIGCKTEPESPGGDALSGGAGASAPATPAAAHPEATDARPLVVCFGDSLTAGYGVEAGQSYPDYLQRALDRAGYHYRVVNEGVSGNTTKDGVDRLAGVVALKPAVVVLEFGGNDGLRGLKVESTRANLAVMIAGLKSAGAKVVLAGITLPPDYGPDYVNSFTASYPVLGRKFGVPVLPFILQNAYGVPGMIQGDGIHATDKGNQIVARNVLPLVEPLLRK